MSDKCACEATSVLVFACSGGSNVGQMANAAAVELAREGAAKMYCLARLGGRVGGMIDSAKGVDYRVVIDGCPVACGRKIMEQADVPIDRYVVVTELGIAKNPRFEWSSAQLARVVEAATDGCASRVVDRPEDETGDCGCSGR